MTHIISSGPVAPDEHKLLEQMYRHRKEVFVDLLGWDVPVLDGRYEIDHFDNPSTIYLMIAGHDSEHWGSMRLLPTTGENLLGDVFPGLCKDAPPNSPHVWEISRFCLSRHLCASERRQVRNRLITQAAKFAIANDIHAFVCVADLAWIEKIRSFGWKSEPLGQPLPLCCGITGALKIQIDGDTPALMEAAGCWNDSELQFIDQLADQPLS